MSALAKGVTVGVLVSASLAIPIVATVSYFQNKPDSTPLLPIESPALPSEPPVAAILELEPLVIEPSQGPPPIPTAEKPKRSRASVRDPARFELELPKVERPPAFVNRMTSSPSVASKGMPPPLARDAQRQLVFEEQFR